MDQPGGEKQLIQGDLLHFLALNGVVLRGLSRTRALRLSRFDFVRTVPAWGLGAFRFLVGRLPELLR